MTLQKNVNKNTTYLFTNDIYFISIDNNKEILGENGSKQNKINEYNRKNTNRY